MTKSLKELNKLRQDIFIHIVDLKKSYLTGCYEIRLKVNKTGLNHLLKIKEDADFENLDNQEVLKK